MLKSCVIFVCGGGGGGQDNAVARQFRRNQDWIIMEGKKKIVQRVSYLSLEHKKTLPVLNMTLNKNSNYVSSAVITRGL